MHPQALTLEQLREPGLVALRQHLGSVGLVCLLQPSDMGWGNDTEDFDMLRRGIFGRRGGADFYGRTPEELRTEFRESLQVLIEVCREKGTEPRRSCKR
jgi:hypothetical protein